MAGFSVAAVTIDVKYYMYKDGLLTDYLVGRLEDEQLLALKRGLSKGYTSVNEMGDETRGYQVFEQALQGDSEGFAHGNEQSRNYISVQTLEQLCHLSNKTVVPLFQWFCWQCLHDNSDKWPLRRMTLAIPFLRRVLATIATEKLYAWTLFLLLETFGIATLLYLSFRIKKCELSKFYCWSIIMLGLGATVGNKYGASPAEYFLIGVPYSISVGMSLGGLHFGSQVTQIYSRLYRASLLIISRYTADQQKHFIRTH